MTDPAETRTLFEGTMLGLTVERWNGEEREIVERADSVAVVAVDATGDLVLVRQFRTSARKNLLELPAGTVDPGEKPLETARRELEEETGLRGGTWRAGPVFYTTPGFCRERIHLFFADELERGEPRPDASEDLELVRWPKGELVNRLAQIEDAKTFVGLLLYARSAS